MTSCGCRSARRTMRNGFSPERVSTSAKVTGTRATERVEAPCCAGSWEPSEMAVVSSRNVRRVLTWALPNSASSSLTGIGSIRPKTGRSTSGCRYSTRAEADPWLTTRFRCTPTCSTQSSRRFTSAIQVPRPGSACRWECAGTPSTQRLPLELATHCGSHSRAGRKIVPRVSSESLNARRDRGNSCPAPRERLGATKCAGGKSAGASACPRWQQGHVCARLYSPRSARSQPR